MKLSLPKRKQKSQRNRRKISDRTIFGKEKFINHMKQKEFIPIIVILIVTAIVGTIGYVTLVKKQSLPFKPNQPPDSDGCNLISNSSFRSINQYEVGRGPNGPAMGYWDVHFQKGTTLSDYGKPTFQWSYSDVGETGTYTCRNNVLQVKFSDRSFTTRYDEIKEVLIWDGVEYKRVK